MTSMRDPNTASDSNPPSRAAHRATLDESELVVDTRSALAALRAEAKRATEHGHRQVTVLHRGPVRAVLFAFDAGGVLHEHRAPGVITIHVLEGELLVRTNVDHVLAAGAVLVLNPDVRHSVHAEHPAAMLLTVHLP